MISTGARMKMSAFLVVGALVLAPACGGGGGDAATGGSPTTLSASFMADQFTPGAGNVSMAQGNRAGDSVTVKVNLTDTSLVFGVAFDVVYDETKATYMGYTAGQALESGNAAPNYTVEGGAQAGRLVVGVSRPGSSGTTTVSGTKTVINLTFRVKALGSFPVSFENAIVTDGQSVPQPLPGISWFAGALQGD